MSDKQIKDDNQKNDNTNKRVVVSTQEVNICPICLTSITNRGVVGVCSHEFCFECIRQWSAEHNRCPICRSVYSNIRYNIVSNEIFDELPVEEQLESDDEAVESILHRFILIIGVITLRNRRQRRRDELLVELNESEQQMERSVVTRTQLKQLRQRIEDIILERRQLDDEIRLFENILSDDVSDEQLIQVLNEREGEGLEIQAIELLYDPDDLHHLDNALLEDQMFDNQSGYESDNERESEEEEEDDSTSQPNASQQKRNTDSESDDSQERSPKRRKRQ